MSRHLARPVVGLLLASAAFVSPAGATSATPHVVAVYPNPVAADDAGEFVTVSFPTPTDLSTCTLADADVRVRLPSRTVTGLVTLSTAPNLTRRLVDGRVGGTRLPRLANAGDRLVLVCGGVPVDAASYRNAPEGKVYRAGAWLTLGRTHFRVRSVRNANATVFALPDDPGVPLTALRGAHRRIRLGGYTFTDRRVAAALRAAGRRGVGVGLVVEGGPVGGVSAREARVLDRLAGAPNVTVTVLDGPRERYRFHHAKYAVVDDAVLVTSENWVPGGVGGHRTRGWGAVVRNATLADRLAAVYRADTTWADDVPWRRYRANATYPSAFEPLHASVGRVSLVVSPDDSRRALRGFVENATRTLAVEQMSIGNDTVLLNATIVAARRGVRVRVLLSGAWYVRAHNAALVRRLNALGARDGLDLRARLADPRGRYGHVHVKAAIADGERVLVGSINWDRNAVRNNREVELVLADPTVGRYYGRLFDADWHGGRWTLPAWLLALALCAGLLAAWRLP